MPSTSYLYVLAADALGYLLVAGILQGHVRGICIPGGEVLNGYFADNSLLSIQLSSDSVFSAFWIHFLLLQLQLSVTRSLISGSLEWMWFLHGLIAFGGRLLMDKLSNIWEFLLVLMFPFLICGTSAYKSYNVSSRVGICRICHLLVNLLWSVRFFT